MEILVIGKPAINVYLPLQEFPQEGDIFTITGKNESLGNVGATGACLLAKWKMPVHFTGIIGNDAYAEKIRNTFNEYKVDIKFLEANFDKSTTTNYIVLNIKSGMSSKILYNDSSVQLTKFKYDFIPNYAIIDGTDYAGAHALLNNNAACKTVFYARIADKDTIAIAKRCSIVVCTQIFAEGMTHMESDDTAEAYVNLYQKIVDTAGNGNFVVILNNHKILYSVDGKVKMLPEMKINIADYSSFDSVFVGALTFCLANNMDLDDAIKLANTAAAISISRIGEVPSIPELDEVLDNSGLREKLGLAREKQTEVKAQEVTPLNPEYNQEQAPNTFATTPEASISSNTLENQPTSNIFDSPNNNGQI